VTRVGAIIFFSIFLVSCQVYNSASRDKLIYGSSVDPNSNFGKATQIIAAKCLSCHAVYGTYTTEAAWISAGLVTSRSLAGSKVYYRLTGANLGVGTENMPVNSTLTSGELSDIRAWILNM
jgi:hypothetical protein